MRVSNVDSTHVSLLALASAGSGDAWARLVDLYRPLVFGWLRKQGVAHHDAEEITQDVLAVLVRELPQFKHSGRQGSFRGWVRGITANRARGFWRSRKLRRTLAGTSSVATIIDQLADDASDLSRQWDTEHDQYVLRHLLSRLDGEFEPATLEAFRRQVFDGWSADRVAAELGMTVGAAYSAKARVLRKLRQDALGLVDESLFS